VRTVGLIVEYNPLHNGHVYHFQQAKKISGAEAAVAVMSGCFLQRGEPAIVDKWARAEMALRMGIDLVIELPAVYAPQPAEWFAFGAVSALDATGIVDCLCFGSESGEIGWMRRLAREMRDESPDFRRLMKRELKKGTSYPAAYSAAIGRYADECKGGRENAEFMRGVPDDELARPNNILGLHYLIALERLGSAIEPLTVARAKAEYHQQDITDRRIASATAVRRLLFESRKPESAAPYVPDYTLDVLRREWANGRAPVGWESFARPLFAHLLNRSAEDLARLAEVSEGLEHRIKLALARIPADAGEPVEALLTALKTKRYTRTKLQRMLANILLNREKALLTREELRRGVPYLRILGFTEKGRQLLKRMKQTSRVPIVTRVAKHRHPWLELDLKASAIYALAYGEVSSREMLRDFTQPPIRLA